MFTSAQTRGGGGGQPDMERCGQGGKGGQNH